MALNPGDLKVPVTIQQVTESAGTSKFPVETWSTLNSTAWMFRQFLSGGEKFTTGQLSSSSIARWEMRYVADMDPDLLDVVKKRRIVYQGRTYDILAAEHIGRQDGIALTTLAGGR